jgi:hypothetical protein
MDASESLKNIWSSIFLRKGGNGAYTRLFDSLEPSQKSVLSAVVELWHNELPIIGSVLDRDNWFIFTTARLAWCISGNRNEIPAQAVCDATVDFRRLRQSGETKLETRRLQLTTKANEKYVIMLEPGQPLSGVWNVLKNLGARNRKALSRSV